MEKLISVKRLGDKKVILMYEGDDILVGCYRTKDNNHIKTVNCKPQEFETNELREEFISSLIIPK